MLVLHCSLSTVCVPSYWLNAILVPHPTKISDFCPISVTPDLSRIAEKIMVCNWLLPFIPAHTLLYWINLLLNLLIVLLLLLFTLLVTLLDFLSISLLHNQYVRCLMTDFRKASDTVDCVILLSKLVKFDFSGFVINWIFLF